MFHSKKGTNYHETFSLVSKKDSFRITMTLVTHFLFRVTSNGCENGIFKWGSRGRGIHGSILRIL